MKKKKAGDIMLSRLTRGGQVSIPFAIRESLGLEEGAMLQFEQDGGRIVVTPVKMVITPIKVVPAKSRKKGG